MGDLRLHRLRGTAFLGLWCLGLVPFPAAGQFLQTPAKVAWKIIAIDPAGTYAGEKTAAADINKDGRMDIVASNWWFEAPPAAGQAWRKHAFRSFGAGDYRTDDALDVDKDGWMDVVSAGPAGFHWWRNPGAFSADQPWARGMPQGDGGGHHQGSFRDLDGDGKAEEFLSNKQATEWFSLENGRFVSHVIETTPTNYGDGAGDINGDGRADILKPAAWFEAPANPRTGAWKKHVIAIGALHADSAGNRVEKEFAWLGRNAAGEHGHTAEIYAYDVNQDGLNDLLCSSAHQWGIFWYEQYRLGGEIKFRQHRIDTTQSLFHSLALADIDKDGDMDLVTGKRIGGHAPGIDPGDTMPPFVAWYELVRAPGKPPQYARHFLSLGGDASSGQKLTVIDIDKDGDLDVVAASKKSGGPFLFLNQLDANPTHLLRSPSDGRRERSILRLARGSGNGFLLTLEENAGYAFALETLRGKVIRRFQGRGAFAYPLPDAVRAAGAYVVRGRMDDRTILEVILLPAR